MLKTDNQLRYFLNLQHKFQANAPALPHGQLGNVKTVSLKAWLRKNDNKRLIDIDCFYGDFLVLGKSYNIEYPLEDRADELFNRALKSCVKEEKRYLALRSKVDEYGITLGVKLNVYSSGKMTIGDGVNERPIKKEEVVKLLDAFEEYESFMNTLLQDISRSFASHDLLRAEAGTKDVIERD